MKQSIYLTDNSSETLNKLESLGYKICPCCKFNGVKWLHHLYDAPSTIANFHGVGNGCENECANNNSEMCIKCSIKESLVYNNEIHIFRNVDSINTYIKNNIK